MRVRVCAILKMHLWVSVCKTGHSCAIIVTVIVFSDFDEFLSTTFTSAELSNPLSMTKILKAFLLSNSARPEEMWAAMHKYLDSPYGCIDQISRYATDFRQYFTKYPFTNIAEREEIVLRSTGPEDSLVSEVPGEKGKVAVYWLEELGFYESPRVPGLWLSKTVRPVIGSAPNELVQICLTDPEKFRTSVDNCVPALMGGWAFHFKGERWNNVHGIHYAENDELVGETDLDVYDILVPDYCIGAVSELLEEERVRQASTEDKNSNEE